MNTADENIVSMVDLVALHAPLKDHLLKAVERVLDHGRFILGPEVQTLETQWAARCGTKHAVGVSDATTALGLVLRALGVGPGDEVITAPNSFIASASCIVHAGATPRFADVGDDFNLDPRAVEQAITEKTRAIIVVHLSGRPADVDALEAVARPRRIHLIEDAAQAMGAKYRGRPVGSLVRAACFSLHPLKTAGACGDAGMITTDDEDLADALRCLRNHGFTTRQEHCRLWGHNARMDTIQAAMALVKLEQLETWIQRRRRNAAIYRERISELVRIPADRPDDNAVYHTFPVEAQYRDSLLDHLALHGIAAKIHYRIPIHKLPVATNLNATPLPVTEKQSRRIISLPIHENLDDRDILRVCDAVHAFYETIRQSSHTTISTIGHK